MISAYDDLMSSKNMSLCDEGFVDYARPKRDNRLNSFITHVDGWTKNLAIFWFFKKTCNCQMRFSHWHSTFSGFSNILTYP